MSLSTFIKLCGKAFRFAVGRPIQRFNIYNRAKKYLGAESKYFLPAPRAIGQMSLNPGKSIQYPHLIAGGSSGFKSIKQRRLEALAKDSPKLVAAKEEPKEQLYLPTKSYSETEQDDELVREASNKLEVSKTIVKVASIQASRQAAQLEAGYKEGNDGGDSVQQGAIVSSSSRPLPKCTSLDLSDPATIWAVDKTPPGRLNLNMLQEMMINRLGDTENCTPKAIAERYNIKEEYADSLIKYLKQIRIVVSPRMKKVLDYTNNNNPTYLATQHLIYRVDKNLRNETDKSIDQMYLPNEQLDEEVKEIIEQPKTGLNVLFRPTNVVKETKRIVKRPEPLRITPENMPAKESSHQKQKQLSQSKLGKLERPKQVPNPSDVT